VDAKSNNRLEEIGCLHQPNL